MDFSVESITNTRPAQNETIQKSGAVAFCTSTSVSLSAVKLYNGKNLQFHRRGLLFGKLSTDRTTIVPGGPPLCGESLCRRRRPTNAWGRSTRVQTFSQCQGRFVWRRLPTNARRLRRRQWWLEGGGPCVVALADPPASSSRSSSLRPPRASSSLQLRLRFPPPVAHHGELHGGPDA